MTDDNLREGTATMTDSGRAREIAKGLTKASRSALPRVGEGWTSEGGAGPKRDDAYSLWWGRDGLKGLIDRPKFEGGRWFYRLTPLGLAVRAALAEGGGDE